MGNIQDRLRKIHVMDRGTGRGLNIQVVGERSTGKTSLVNTFMNECPPETKTDAPKGDFDLRQKKVKVKNKKVDITIFDFTSFTNVKYLVHGIVICFSLDNRESLHKLEEFWIPELRKNYPQVPMLLVGTKRDLRDNARKIDGFVRDVEGRLLAQKHKLKGYIECSSDTGENVEDVFSTVISSKK